MVPPDFLDQAEFLQALRIEEKRAQRSGMAFGLAEIEVSSFSRKSASSRKRQFGGWATAFASGYRSMRLDCGRSTMGVIFIELPPQTALATSESLVMDLKASLEILHAGGKGVEIFSFDFPEA